jgi:hypothetical protein
VSFTLRPAVRQNVSLLIGLAGASGSGKTFTAMRLASGIANGKRFAVIDTEAGRAKHYADRFQFDHGDLTPPFAPAAYENAILEVDKQGYPVIVVDSMSHEWYGDGGVLDMQEEEHKKSGYSEGSRMASWIRPKMAHKQMMQKLLQVRAHLILCFRAEPKIEMVKEGGKTVVRPKESLIGYGGWIPVTEKSMPYELTVSIMLTPDTPGVPHPIKLQEQHKALFPPGLPIDEDAGMHIAEWARGGQGATADVGPTGATGASIGDVDEIRAKLREKSLEGVKVFRPFWETLDDDMKDLFRESGEFEAFRDAARKAEVKA